MEFYTHRATRDVDLLGVGEATIPHLVEVFEAICRMEVEADGLTFIAKSVDGSLIREYQGVRLSLSADLAGAHIRLQVDIGFGDAVTPDATTASYPVMLDQPAPVLLVYPRESVVAEKVEAMVSLGIANTRMKDFYDLRALADAFEFDGSVLCRAIQATFGRRHTAVPNGPPFALTDAFAEDAAKIAQWHAFQNKMGTTAEHVSLHDVMVSLSDFIVAPLVAAAMNQLFLQHWSPGGGWSELAGC